MSGGKLARPLGRRHPPRDAAGNVQRRQPPHRDIHNLANLSLPATQGRTIHTCPRCSASPSVVGWCAPIRSHEDREARADFQMISSPVSEYGEICRPTRRLTHPEVAPARAIGPVTDCDDVGRPPFPRQSGGAGRVAGSRPKPWQSEEFGSQKTAVGRRRTVFLVIAGRR
jgi:hypothetical protein